MLDKDGDGVLSKEELNSAIWKSKMEGQWLGNERDGLFFMAFRGLFLGFDEV